jgi:hypothetical protein
VIVIRLEVEWQRVPFGDDTGWEARVEWHGAEFVATAETKQEAQESIVQALRAQGDDAVVM